MSARTGISLANRVALAAALAAAIGGGGAAAAAGVAARQLIGEREQAQVRAAVQEMADELREALNDGDEDQEEVAQGKSMDARLSHELDDLKLPFARAALRSRARLVAGDASLPVLAAGACREDRRGDELERACAVAFGDAVLVLSVPGKAEWERAELVTRALWIGVFSGALLGGLFSYFVARWALLPLSALRDRVRAVRADQPRAALLSPRAAQPEIEELRGAVALLVERLADSLDQARAFASEAAHELRTPLTTIAGELELLAEGGASDDEAVRRVRAQVAGLIVLVQRLLVLAQPESAELGGNEAVDLGDVLHATLAALPARARARVEAKAEDDVLVRGDAALLSALLSNGLDNALKFSSEGIEVHVGTRAGAALITVRDRGPGLSDAERERVFAPFYRAPEVRAGGTEGHGLGLALIAKVARLHGGEARFEPCAQGASLTIALPLFAAELPLERGESARPVC